MRRMIPHRFKVMLPYLVSTSTGEVAVPYSDGTFSVPSDYGILTNRPVDGKVIKLLPQQYRVITMLDVEGWLDDVAETVLDSLSDEVLTSDEISDTIQSEVELYHFPIGLFLALPEEFQQEILRDIYIDKIIERVKDYDVQS